MSKDSRRKKQAVPKPRGEQLLDRLKKNPNDREAWNELARGIRTPQGKSSTRPATRTTKKSAR